jgi:hypothetical protein
MSTRRLSVVTALAAAACLLTSQVPAGASVSNSSGVMNRGDRRGQTPPDGTGGEAGSEEAVDDCPTELWTIPLEIKGLACILVLGKPAGEEPAE